MPSPLAFSYITPILPPPHACVSYHHILDRSNVHLIDLVALSVRFRLRLGWTLKTDSDVAAFIRASNISALPGSELWFFLYLPTSLIRRYFSL